MIMDANVQRFRIRGNFDLLDRDPRRANHPPRDGTGLSNAKIARINCFVTRAEIPVPGQEFVRVKPVTQKKGEKKAGGRNHLRVT